MKKSGKIAITIISLVLVIGIIVLLIILLPKKKNTNTTPTNTTTTGTIPTTTLVPPTKTYSIKFLDYDGSLLSDEIVEEGKMPLMASQTMGNKIVFGNRVFEYEFKGWDKEIVKATKDTTYQALYDKKDSVIFRDGNNYYLGSYPQSLEEDEDIISSLNDKAGTIPSGNTSYNWINYGYSPTNCMYYQDFDLDDDGYNDYRGVYIKSKRWIIYPDGSSNNMFDFEAGKTYWFKYEPIKWNILKTEDNNTLLISDLILDSQQFSDRQAGKYNHNGGYGYSSDYSISDIRMWINNTFYPNTFNDTENDKISTTVVINYHDTNTEDKVFLLSKDEAEEFYHEFDEFQAYGSMYAKSQNLDLNYPVQTSEWRLRTKQSNVTTYAIDNMGSIAVVAFPVLYTSVGFRPAMNLGNIDSKICTLTTINDDNIGGRITVSNNNIYEEGTEITVEATPNQGYEFNGWYDGETLVSNDEEYTFTIDENTTITAKWDKIPNYYSLTTVDSGHGEAGTITNYTNQLFKENTIVKLVASPGSKFTFDGWYDGNTLLSEDLEYDHEMTKDIQITAKWVLIGNKKFTLTTENDNLFAGTITSYTNKTFTGGTEITVSASVDEYNCYTFKGWYNGEKLMSEKESYTFYIKSDLTLTAKWTRYNLTTMSIFNDDNIIPEEEDIYIGGKFTKLNSPKTAETKVSLEALERGDSTFVGWYELAADDTYQLVSEDMSFEYDMPKSDKTLYVKYLLYKYVNEEHTKVAFGYYPQAILEYSVTTAKCEWYATGQMNDYPEPTANNSYLFTNYGYYNNGAKEKYMWYQDLDIDEDGEFDHRAVYFRKTRAKATTLSYGTAQYDQYFIETYYYFKYEPIIWDVIEDGNGFKTLFAESILDAQNFDASTKPITYPDETKTYPNNYEESDLIYWLNHSFLNWGFDKIRQSFIINSIIDNSIESTGSSEAIYEAENTVDKVFLLSRVEYNRLKEKFPTMTTTGTDYAKCQRLPVETSGVYANKSWYWLRSATTETTESSMNYAQVAMDCSYESTMDVKYVYGIRPAINLPL